MDLEDVVRAAQLASALEVSGYPKPGNVHRTADLEEATFEQFIASSIAIGPALRGAVRRGFKAGKGVIEVSEIGIGKAIKMAIRDTMDWQKDENTNLGVVMLLVPLTAAAGMTLAWDGKMDLKKLRKNLSIVLESTTPEDALGVYDAIKIAKPGGLGKVDELDVMDPASTRKIREKKISIYEIMNVSSGWDNISKEWVTGMRITFEFGFPFFKEFCARTGNLNTAIVHTYLELISRYPDTFVRRIYGEGAAREISERAREVLGKGGMLTARGRKAVRDFDKQLRKRGINPGTSADLTCSSLMLSILDGLRP